MTIIGMFDAFCKLHKVLDKQSLANPEPLTRLLASSSKETKFKGFVSTFDDPRDWSSAQFTHLINEPLVWITFGVSPVYVSYCNPETLLVLERHLQINPRVKAIGPIGFHGENSFEQGKEVDISIRRAANNMSGLVAMAYKWNKPVCLSSYGWITRRMILTCDDAKILFLQFNGTWIACNKLLRWYPNCMIGFVENAFDPDVARKVPLDRILFMSNAPEWCEVEGKQRQPGMGAFRAALQFARVRDIPVKEAIEKNEENVRWFYEI